MTRVTIQYDCESTYVPKDYGQRLPVYVVVRRDRYSNYLLTIETGDRDGSEIGYWETKPLKWRAALSLLADVHTDTQQMCDATGLDQPTERNRLWDKINKRVTSVKRSEEYVSLTAEEFFRDQSSRSVAEDLGISASTTDEEIEVIAQKCVDEAGVDGVDEIVGIDDHLLDVRAWCAEQPSEKEPDEAQL